MRERTVTAVKSFLPRGGSLPYEQWERRHRVIVVLLWVHAAGLTLFGLVRGYSVVHTLGDTSVIAAAAAFASWNRLGRKWQSTVAAFGLVAASGVFVHLSGGVIEVHFHFFVMVVVLSLYEDWIPFLVAIAFVVIEHGAMGVIDPQAVYNHASAIRNPWTWALIHGGFVLAESAACLVAWRKNEDTRLDLQHSVETLSASEERFRSLVQNASDIAILCDRDAYIKYVSPSVKKVFGYEPDTVLGRERWTFIHPEDVDFAIAAWEAAITTTDPVAPIEYRAKHADGSWRWCEVIMGNLLDDPSVEGVVLNIRDITERKSAEEAMLHQAFHDTLTGLPNRALFLDRLGQALSRRGRIGSLTAVLFLDLDRFKWINDSLGHAAGDELLVQVAARLSSAIRSGDSVARFGGDEFVVLCDELDGDWEARVIAERIGAALKDHFCVEGRDITVTASIGFATTAAASGATPDALLRDADAAMYRAKERGRHRIEAFQGGMRAMALERLEVETDLRRALERDELVVHYQPVVRMTGAMVGVEALVRWQHPEKGLVPPGEFIPVAEETGLIQPLGAFVLHEACRQVASWNRDNPDRAPLSVAVNLSARQMSAADLTRLVLTALNESGLEPGLLCLEITESVLMEDVTASRSVLQSLKELGVRLGIDDFGTGYSSLLYLRRFPVDFLKVDRSFVSGLGENSEDGAIVAGVLGLAHALGVGAIAEGVEEPAQADKLAALGCEQAQGFLWSRPLPAAELEASFERLWLRVATPERDPGEPVRVVLADDRSELRATVRLALELAGGFEVVGEAGTGTEAIAVAREKQPDLLLLDVLMPGMTGLEAMPYIANVAPRTKVVILTAIDAAVLESEKFQGATAAFDKGIGPSRLVQQLQELFSAAPAHS
ncbi:MAG TPA: EAL domain-containing protein [Acidimicrobiales bacterium]|jgi:diguanylate cyclase (GGDEF)-like protein/PAS domain S-box-containing protein|nr:EAL domain-containing protein [Acidimicrobiales bacterium]